MKLIVGVAFAPIRCGIEASAPDLKIRGHGRDRSKARDSLERGVRAWAIGLKSAGSDSLAHALESRRITWEPDGEAIEVEFEEL